MNASEKGTGASAASAVIRVDSRAAAVGTARRRLRAALEERDLPAAAVDDAELVASELLGNSVRHARPIAGGFLLLAWVVSAGQVTVRVTDGGAGRAVRQRPDDPLADSGRGLRIVERLADRWGVVDHAGGLRSVWAVIPVAGSATALRLVGRRGSPGQV